MKVAGNIACNLHERVSGLYYDITDIVFRYNIFRLQLSRSPCAILKGSPLCRLKENYQYIGLTRTSLKLQWMLFTSASKYSSLSSLTISSPDIQ